MSEEINSRTERRQAQDKSRKKSKKPKNGKGIFKKIFLALVIIGFAVLIGGVGLFGFYASSSPKLDEELLRDPVSSEFIDPSGNVFHTTGQEKRVYVNYDEIPELMEEAILATEDVRFYTHGGMDFYRLGGAVLANFKSGFGSQGASTITQQVIKNSFLKNDKNLKRKSQEAWMAFQLERKYDKEEIFEMYFNKILMSGNNYGFGTAADYFYGKKLSELELHEAAMLAGLPQSPNGYNPRTNPERAEKRRNIVLGLMYQHDKISKEDMEAAKAIDVTSTLLADDQRALTDNTKYPAFVDLVLNELEEAGMQDVLAEGVQIHTTLDPQAQLAVEDALKYTPYKNDTIQAGLTVIDTKTGAIVAVGGGRNYVAGNLSFATQEKHQLGSVIKPILSYGPAIEYLNWSTGQTVHDTEYKYKDSDTPVRNYDPTYQGAITMREALSRSRNVPAVKTYEEVGRADAINFAGKLGITLTNDLPSNALGGASDEFTTADLAGAYAPFGNGGIYTKPHTIKKVVFRDGKTEKNLTPDPVAVMKDSTAYMITDMLRDVLTSGTGTRANISGLDIAGKTGTTNFVDKDGAKDSWFAGYTSNYSIAAWSGYQDRKTPMTQMELERFIPQDLFKQVMSTISAGKETANFKRPSSVEEGQIVYKSDPLMRASASTPSSMKRTELFVKGSTPKEVAKTIKLDAPTNLNANYNQEQNSVSLNWSHKAPDSKVIKDVNFIVYASVDGGERKEINRTSDFSMTVPDVEYGKNYTFEVVAVAGDLVSDSTSVTLRIEEPEEEVNEDEEKELEQQEEEEKKKQEELEKELEKQEEEEKKKQEEIDKEVEKELEEEQKRQEELEKELEKEQEEESKQQEELEKENEQEQPKEEEVDEQNP